jgi:hypothetical protein
VDGLSTGGAKPVLQEEEKPSNKMTEQSFHFTCTSYGMITHDKKSLRMMTTHHAPKNMLLAYFLKCQQSTKISTNKKPI